MDRIVKQSSRPGRPGAHLPSRRQLCRDTAGLLTRRAALSVSSPLGGGFSTAVVQAQAGEPNEIRRAAVWPVSDYSDYVRDVSLFVDGGMTIYPRFETCG